MLELPEKLRPRFLDGLTNAELDALLSEGTHRNFAASSVIVQQDDPAERLFLLTSGRGRHFVITGDGQKILLHWLTAGQIFGGAAIVSSPSRYVASTEILSAGCALVWERKAIRALAIRIQRLLDNALSIAVTEHVAWLTAARVSLSSADVQSRLAHLLVSLACGIGKSSRDGVEIPVGNEELGSAAGATQFTVSRILSKWQRDGILRKGRGRIILRRPELLADA
ncbi:MAG TPA: Crp/Fnr family transcriptional regulator [Vicinamibacterales bacterium]|nr:Crp/Fnr family transcriptional regulator [Vicinamibacterales bacterium]